MQKPQLTVEHQLTEHQLLIHIVGNRLFAALLVALAIAVVWSSVVYFADSLDGGSAPVVLFIGVLGGLIGLQNRLVRLGDADLLLLAKSTTYLLLAPLVGGFLAVLLYILFISGLLQGDLFPNFTADAVATPDSAANDENSADLNGISRIFRIHGDGPEDYAKLIFWCFLAGFSERFVTNLMGRFEHSAIASVPGGESSDADRVSER